MKIFKTKKLILAVVAAIISLSIMPFFQSCSNDFDTSAVTEEAKKANVISSEYEKVYLELKVNDTKNLTVEQKLILKEAIKRADPFVTFDALKKEYVLSANCKELNISAGLFKIVEGIIEKTNSEIKKVDVYQDKKDSKLLHVRMKKSSLKSNVRRKIDFFESYEPIPDGASGYDMRWYGCDVYLNNDKAKDLTYLLAAGATVSGIVAIIGVNAPAGVVSALLGLASTAVGTYNDGKGVIIEVTAWGDVDIVSR